MEREDISFVNKGFFELQPLNKDNVLEYFSTSPFYDKSCNNEVLKMQTQFRLLDKDLNVSTMVGLFYEVMDTDEPFVIKKAYNNGDSIDALRFYYIIHGYIYCAPTNYSIYRYRVSNAMWILNSFINKMIEKKKFNPFTLNKVESQITMSKENEELEFMMEVFNDTIKNQ